MATVAFATATRPTIVAAKPSLSSSPSLVVSSRKKSSMRKKKDTIKLTSEVERWAFGTPPNDNTHEQQQQQQQQFEHEDDSLDDSYLISMPPTNFGLLVDDQEYKEVSERVEEERLRKIRQILNAIHPNRYRAAKVEAEIAAAPDTTTAADTAETGNEHVLAMADRSHSVYDMRPASTAYTNYNHHQQQSSSSANSPAQANVKAKAKKRLTADTTSGQNKSSNTESGKSTKSANASATAEASEKKLKSLNSNSSDISRNMPGNLQQNITIERTFLKDLLKLSKQRYFAKLGFEFEMRRFTARQETRGCIKADGSPVVPPPPPLSHHNHSTIKFHMSPHATSMRGPRAGTSSTSCSNYSDSGRDHISSSMASSGNKQQQQQQQPRPKYTKSQSQFAMRSNTSIESFINDVKKANQTNAHNNNNNNNKTVKIDASKVHASSAYISDLRESTSSTSNGASEQLIIKKRPKTSFARLRSSTNLNEQSAARFKSAMMLSSAAAAASAASQRNNQHSSLGHSRSALVDNSSFDDLDTLHSRSAAGGQASGGHVTRPLSDTRFRSLVDVMSKPYDSPSLTSVDLSGGGGGGGSDSCDRVSQLIRANKALQGPFNNASSVVDKMTQSHLLQLKYNRIMFEKTALLT